MNWSLRCQCLSHLREIMNNDDAGSILINLVDGTRQPLPATVKWSATIHDGRPPSEWQLVTVKGVGSAELIKNLTYFDNLFDNYTVIIDSQGYDTAAWMPIHLSPAKPAGVELMLVPKDAHLNFRGASWSTLSSVRPRFAQLLSNGIDDATGHYGNMIEQNEGLVLACALNLLTAMSQIVLPSEKSPLDYYWQPIWNDPQFPAAQDRFFAYVDQTLVADVVKAGTMGSFSEEKDPGVFHPGATLSYKQTQFDVANVQLTFHQGNARTIQTPDGAIDCVVVEPDIDYYKDLISHFFGEVLPNKFKGNLTDPRAVYMLRWMAGKQEGSDFNPLYTLTT
jgi:hypothetical protein